MICLKGVLARDHPKTEEHGEPGRRMRPIAEVEELTHERRPEGRNGKACCDQRGGSPLLEDDHEEREEEVEFPFQTDGPENAPGSVVDKREQVPEQEDLGKRLERGEV